MSSLFGICFLTISLAVILPAVSALCLHRYLVRAADEAIGHHQRAEWKKQVLAAWRK